MSASLGCAALSAKGTAGSNILGYVCCSLGRDTEFIRNHSMSFRQDSHGICLVTRPKYPPYRETGVAIRLSHCVSCGIADYRCYTPTSFLKNGVSQSKTGLTRGVSQKKLASEAYRAIGGVARSSVANRAIVGH